MSNNRNVMEVTAKTAPFDPDTTIPFEEDTIALQERFAAALGPNGKYDPTGHLAKIIVPRHGVVWYGDLTRADANKAVGTGIGFGVAYCDGSTPGYN